MPDQSHRIDSTPMQRAMCGLAALGALGLLASSFLPLLRLSSADPGALRGQTTTYSGLDRHSVSLIMIALVALPAAALALRGIRIAPFALLLCALAALLIAVGVDLPELHRSGMLGVDFAPAKATAGAGYYVETLGAVLLLLSAGGLAAFGPRLGGGSGSAAEQR